MLLHTESQKPNNQPNICLFKELQEYITNMADAPDIQGVPSPSLLHLLSFKKSIPCKYHITILSTC